jgi:hypothetical protein
MSCTLTSQTIKAQEDYYNALPALLQLASMSEKKQFGGGIQGYPKEAF